MSNRSSLSKFHLEAIQLQRMSFLMILGSLRKEFRERIFKKRRPVDIRYDKQGFVKWRDITISCTIQNSVVIPARSVKVLYLKVKNPEIKTGLVPRLDLGEELYAGNAIVTNRIEKAYIKIANTLDTDRCIDVPEVELEKIERIAHRPTKSKRRVKGIRSCAVNVVAMDHVPSA